MKNLFNNISQEEKNMILEMHSGRKNTISEQSNDKHPTDSKLWINMLSDVEGEGVDTIKETPNQLVIGGITGTWTITYKK